MGKTSVAKQLGLRLGRSWLHVDDVRLAFQRSHVTLPEKTEALYFFEEAPALWSLPPEGLRDGLIGVGGPVVTRPSYIGTHLTIPC
jgi:predicted kinase